MYGNPYEQGKFIVFEGLDGSGKSLRSKLLKQIMEKRGFSVFLTKEPTSHTKEGRKIKKVLKGEIEIDLKELQELYTKDRLKHIKREIIPALDKGKYVISDRYFFSTFAYGFASGIDLKYLYNLNEQTMLPDALFFVNTDVITCLDRKNKLKEDNEFFEKKMYLRKAKAGYQKSISDFKDNIEIVKTISGKLKKEELIQTQVRMLLKYFKSS